MRGEHRILQLLFLTSMIYGSMFASGGEFQQSTDRFHIREELSIGAAVGEPEYMFSRISDVAKDDSGRIFVLDYIEAELRIFDQAGKHIRTVGRKGQGPGEFMAPISLGITDNDTVMVYDLINHRISYFSPGGEYMSSFSTADMIMTGSDVDAQGNIMGLVFTSGPGEQILELKRFDKRKNTLASYLTITKKGREATGNPLGPDFYWTRYLADHVICGYSKTYELFIYDLDGNIVRTIKHQYIPVRIAPEEIAALKKRLPVAVDVQAPKYHSAFQGITADEEGRIFIATWERSNSGKGYLYDVFDSTGSFVTLIELEYPPRLWKDSRLYTIEEDRDGYLLLRRYAVIWQ